MKIGIVTGSMKPVHAGHWQLITTAAKENDLVELFVSTSDRKRKGQVSILGRDMESIWKNHLEPALPQNVKITYGGSPIGNAWKLLGEAEESGSSDTFRIYSDPTDLAARFSEKQLMKYVPNMYSSGHIETVPLSRQNTVDVSGTRMRELLSHGSKEEFMQYLPPIDDKAKEDIWNTLRSNVSESLIRTYISLMIS